MGCDIHLYVEHRKNGRWVSADTWKPDEDEEGEPKPLTVPFGAHFYDERNYDLFGMLADVRNGSGFAGIDTGDGFVPIAAPRGIPSDMSPELAVEAGRMLEHTPSWLTVAELLAYDWTRVTTKRGVVSGPEYHDWAGHRKGKGLGPKEYSGSIFGHDIVHIDESDMKRRVEEIVANVGSHWWAARDEIKRLDRMYCAVSWPSPYYRQAGKFLSECLPRLWRLGSPENVRIVFWFDS